MNFTVADALRVEPLSHGQVIAGAGGLDNVIKSVSVLEVVFLDAPSTEQFVTGDALEISSLYSVMHSVEKQVKTLRYLREKGVAGFVLCHVGIVIKEVAQELLDACDEIDLPLILMPPRIGYKEIIRSVSDALLDNQNLRLRSAIKIYDYITSLLIESKDSTALVGALEKLISRTVLYFNHNAVPVYAPGMSAEVLDAISASIRQHSAYFLEKNSDVTVHCEGVPGSVRLYPVRSSYSYFGVLAVIGDAPLGELDNIAVLQTRNALSIATLNKIGVTQQRKQLVSDFINDLIAGRCEDERILASRSAALHCNIHQARGVILLDIFNFSQMTAEMGEDSLASLKNDYIDHVENELSALSPSSICCASSDKVIILCIDSCEVEAARRTMQHIGRSLQHSLKTHLDLVVSVGLGSPCESHEDIKASYETAVYAIQIAVGAFAEPLCINSADYPAYVLLMQACSGRENGIQAAVQTLLEPMRRYDRENNGSLEETFRILIQCDLDAGIAARRMYLHKNTVLQRRRKIAGLYENDPFQLPERRQFEIVLTLEQLLLRTN